MKTLLLLLLLSACASKPSVRRINGELTVQEITKDTYVVTDTVYFDSNVLVAQMKDGTVVIASSPYETVGAQALVDWIKAKLNPTKIIAINTHFHPDGTGGNAAFDKNGVETYASELTNRLSLQNAVARRKAQAERFKGEYAQRVLNRDITPAQKLFKPRDGLLMNFGGENVEVIYPGPSHTMDNMVVYLPGRKVLFGGCMIRPAQFIGPLEEGDLDQWDMSVESLSPLAIEHVIPGHGPVGDKSYLRNTVQLVRKERAARMK